MVPGADESGEEVSDVTYKEAFTGPAYRKATFVGISIAAIQQMTGINVIMFYSNTIFASGTSLGPNQVSNLIGVVNFLSTFGGLILLSNYGRNRYAFQPGQLGCHPGVPWVL